MSSDILIRKPLSEQMYEKIKNKIISQELKCGEKINIDDLSRLYQVSITPIREAINQLKQEGLVEFVPNIGARVFNLDKDILRNINESCCYFDRLAFSYIVDNNLIEETIQELDTILENQKVALSTKDEVSFFNHSIQFHETPIKKIKNEILKKSIMQIRGQYNIAIKFFYSDDEYKKNSIKEHEKILKTLNEKNYELLNVLLKNHYLESFEKFADLYFKHTAK